MTICGIRPNLADAKRLNVLGQIDHMEYREVPLSAVFLRCN